MLFLARLEFLVDDRYLMDHPQKRCGSSIMETIVLLRMLKNAIFGSGVVQDDCVLQSSIEPGLHVGLDGNLLTAS